MSSTLPSLLNPRPERHLNKYVKYGILGVILLFVLSAVAMSAAILCRAQETRYVVAGGLGMAPSADIGDTHAVFQPCHGTAPDIASFAANLSIGGRSLTISSLLSASKSAATAIAWTMSRSMPGKSLTRPKES